MAQRDTDAFTYSNGALPTVSSAKWTQLSGMGVISVISNAITGASGADSTAAITTWNYSTTDQYARCLIPTVADGGPTVRSNTVSTFYLFTAISAGTYHMYKCVTASFTELGSGAGTPASNDVAYIEMQGNTLIGKQNQVVRITITNETSIASGKPGAHIFGNVTRLDDWSAGDFLNKFLVNAGVRPYPFCPGRAR